MHPIMSKNQKQNVLGLYIGSQLLEVVPLLVKYK